MHRVTVRTTLRQGSSKSSHPFASRSVSRGSLLAAVSSWLPGNLGLDPFSSGRTTHLYVFKPFLRSLWIASAGSYQGLKGAQDGTWWQQGPLCGSTRHRHWGRPYETKAEPTALLPVGQEKSKLRIRGLPRDLCRSQLGRMIPFWSLILTGPAVEAQWVASPRGHYHRLMCLSGFHGKSPLGQALCSVEGDRDE